VRRRSTLGALAALLVLGGCAAPEPAPVIEQGPLGQGAVAKRVAVPEPKPLEAERAPEPSPASLSPGVETGAPAASAALERNPALVGLAETARAQTRSGAHDRAAATLERALRIEPRDPWLWHQLARVRFAQGALDQAAQLAVRSNTYVAGAYPGGAYATSAYATSDRRIEAANWRLLAAVRERQGDLEGARAAAARADAID